MVPVEGAAASIRPERVVELARQICAIPSPLGEEGKVGALIAETLDRPGVDVHYEEVVAGRPNVVATVRGAGRRAPLVLNGHTDASVHRGPWRRDPYEPWVEDGRQYGGGITDMKGAVAAMVAAVEALAGREPPGDVILQAVMHHDGTGLGTKYLLAAEGPTRGWAICAEPSDLTIHTGNAGAVKFEIILRGRTAHVSRMEEGIDVIPTAAAIAGAVNASVFRHEAHPRLPDLPRALVGQLVAGTGPGHVADEAVLRGDVRIVPGMDRTTVRADLERLVEPLCPPDVEARVRIISTHRPFLGATEGVLVDRISAAHAALRGSPPRVTSELPGQAFVTDAADLAAAGLETVVYGPGVWQHAPDQSLVVEDLVDAARVFAAVAESDGWPEVPA